MGDAPGMRLADLRADVLRRLGPIAKGMAGGVDEIVATTLRFWPERAMNNFAVRSNPRDTAVVHAVDVIAAKTREYLEARWGTDANTAAALDKLVQPVVIELASVWFSAARTRAAFRACIIEAIREKV